MRALLDSLYHDFLQSRKAEEAATAESLPIWEQRLRRVHFDQSAPLRSTGHGRSARRRRSQARQPARDWLADVVRAAWTWARTDAAAEKHAGEFAASIDAAARRLGVFVSDSAPVTHAGLDMPLPAYSAR
jgi:hypothetical protein